MLNKWKEFDDSRRIDVTLTGLDVYKLCFIEAECNLSEEEVVKKGISLLYKAAYGEADLSEF